jgi:vitamin B12 transporter
VQRAFRLPTFTERFYVSPVSIGNPELAPESGWCGESGVSWSRPAAAAGATWFYRDEHNRVDWVAASAAGPWRAVNLARAGISGVSVDGRLAVRDLFTLRAFCTGMIKGYSGDPGTLSRYGVNTLRRMVSASLTHAVTDWMEQTWLVTVKQRTGFDTTVLIDAKSTIRIGKAILTLDAENLTDSRESDIPGVPMPGRALFAGWELRSF